MNWAVFALLAPIFWAIANPLHRYIQASKVRDSITAMWLLSLMTIPYVVLMYVLFEFGQTNILLACAVGVLYMIGGVAYLIALLNEEVSRVVPLWSMIPLFVLVESILFLDETLVGYQFVSFILILGGGVLVLSREWKDVLRPRKAFWIMSISSFTYASGQVMSKPLFETYEYWSSFATINVATFVSISLVLLVHARRNTESCKASLRAAWAPVVFGCLLLADSLDTVGDGLFHYALRTGPTPLISVLSETQSVFLLIYMVVFGRFMHHSIQEHNTPKIIIQKATAIGMMMIGVVLLFT